MGRNQLATVTFKLFFYVYNVLKLFNLKVIFYFTTRELALFADAIIDMLVVLHRILTSMIIISFVVTTHRHELNMVLDYWSLIRAMFRTRNAITHMLRAGHSYQPTRVAVDVKCCFRCVCLIT